MKNLPVDSPAQSHLGYEKLIADAFVAREKRDPHWADGLLHVIVHDQKDSLAFHHQHSQYHLVLFWIENLFPDAARWIGVREMARLALDFLEHSSNIGFDPVQVAQRFVDSLSEKRANKRVAQLECLMRCGLARWKIASARWRPDLAQLPRDKGFVLVSLLEHQQAACVESTGAWSIATLWEHLQNPSTAPGNPDDEGEQDVIVFFREGEWQLNFQGYSKDRLQTLLKNVAPDRSDA